MHMEKKIYARSTRKTPYTWAKKVPDSCKFASQNGIICQKTSLLGKFSPSCVRGLNGHEPYLVRVRTHDQNFVPLVICNKTVTLPKIKVPPCQINDPPSQIKVPDCQIIIPYGPRDIQFQEGHIFLSRFDHVYVP